MQLKSYSEIVNQMIESISNRTSLSNFNTGSVIRTMIEVFSEVTSELFAFIGNVLKEAYLSTTSGYWLDLKAKEYGVTRKEAVKTEGNVLFSRLLPSNVNVVIPAGSIIATGVDQSGNDKKYITISQSVLRSGEIEIIVPVIAEHPGGSYNVGSSAIKYMKTFIKGIVAITNQSDWITCEGTDKEDDESLRKRVFLAWDELARGGTKAAYISWAMSVTGVKQAFVNDSLPRGQGTVDIYILSESGLPTPALINQIQEVINKNKPICSDALVRAPANVHVAVNAHIVPLRGFDIEIIEAEIKRRLVIYFSGFSDNQDSDFSWITPLGVGRDVIQMQLIEVIMSVDGIYNLELFHPDRDVGIAAYEFPTVGQLTFTFGAPKDV